MISLSTEFKQALAEDRADYLVQIDITLKDGTKLRITENEIWGAGLSLEDAVSADNTFNALGSTIINQAKITIDNGLEQYNAFDFKLADVNIKVGMALEGRIEWIQKGVYFVDEATFTDSIIELTCLDNMAKFDFLYQTGLTFPATLQAVVQDCCTKCGVMLQSYNFPRYNTTVPAAPTQEGTTFRQVVGWIATLAGCFARCNKDGKLELRWFDTAALTAARTGFDGGTFDSGAPYHTTGDTADGGTFNPWNDGASVDGGTFETDGVHYISKNYAQEISIDNVVITGVEITVPKGGDNSDTITNLYGQPGYTIQVKDNPFITKDNVAAVGGWLTSLVGLTFRKANVQHGCTPAIEAGDVALVWDRKDREFPILVTRTNFVPQGQQTTVSAAETPSRNTANRQTAASAAAAQVQKLVREEQTLREQQLENITRAMEAKSGLYTTTETPASGGRIFYMHDKPTKAASTIVWKMTAEAWGVSTDGGKTWNGGMTVDGDTITRILTATGINANWINTGTISSANNNTSWNLSTGALNMKSGSIAIGSNFSVTDTGKMTCKNANIQGEITSSGGGYWSGIRKGQLQFGADNNSADCILSGTRGWATLTGPAVKLQPTNGGIWLCGQIVTKDGILGVEDETVTWTDRDGTGHGISVNDGIVTSLW